jgi:Trk K+ transport system NAD-binding subunit
MRHPTQLQIYARYARYLLWEFRWPVLVFASLVLAGGLVLHLGYHHRQLSYLEACYAVFMLVFLEPYLDFPEEWYLQPVFFLLPIIGLGAVADSVVRLAYLTFAKKTKLPEWQRMVASLHRNHIVVVGVGKVGYRVIKGLLALGERIVAIERVDSSLLLDEVLDLGVPVIKGDGRQRKILEQAGVAEARAAILATEDDLANLDAALTARDIQPGIRLVLRLFDDTLAVKVAGAFAMPVISTAQVAAPAFIAAATGRKIYQEFELAGRPVHLTDLTVCPGGGLANRTVGEIQSNTDVNIVMHSGPGGVNVNPDHDVVLAAGDSLLVIAPMDRLRILEQANQPGEQES